MVEIEIKKELSASTGPLMLDIKMTFEKGSFISITGSSGSGKSSLFRMISGLMKPDQGLVKFNDEVWFDSQNQISISTKSRNTGFLFQDYALFPNMSVLQNLKYAAGKENQYFVEELIQIMDIEGFLDKNPLLLSGGQQQRVALARALVRKPGLLLLDEPMSALDIQNREKIQFYLKKVYKKYNLTVMMVSHNAPEIIRLSDKVFKIEQGKVVNEGITMHFFGNKTTGNRQLQGEVIRKNSFQDHYSVELLVGDQIINLDVPKEKYDSLNESDKLTFEIQLL